MSTSSFAEFELTRLVISSGGGYSEGGAWSSTGTLGQADAAAAPLCSEDGASPGACEGSSFELVGGFWAGQSRSAAHSSCGEQIDCLFRDGFEADQ
ncbi:hypothetical protein OS187_08630 [Xanthomonadaceae bacterium JHOS43]|nr:hypothetical protein [Xanthomonadaceae bacterium JHOS43]MCX7564011.1 hypothetical protein [Xanthomonadaceae bacterium XH05]